MTTTSSFMCETVRVAGVEKHPNAKKLVLLQLATKDGPLHYTVVDSLTSNRQVGDLVVYVSVDSLVPLEGHKSDQWQFLKGSLDYKPGQQKYRIRGRNIRGVRSQGIVIDAPHRSYLGEDLAFVLNIEKYLNPDEIQLEPPQKSKKKWWQKLFRIRPDSWLSHVPQYGVTNLRRLWPFAEKEAAVYTEKLHGTNVRFGRVGGKFIVGSHRRWVTDTRKWWMRPFVKYSKSSGWYGEDLYEKTVLNCIRIENLPNNVIFYGEIFGKTFEGKPIQDMTYGRSYPGLRVFAAFDVKSGKWWNWLDLQDNQEVIGYGLVPQVYVGMVTLERVIEKSEGNSLVSREQSFREGIVVHSLERPGVAGKYVSDSYHERG